MAKTQVAVVVSGGASLGAYMAGALDELIRAFNAAPDAYEIDIIVGTSAGATTGGLLAHELLYRADRPALHRVWVEDVDIRKLLAPEPDPPPGADPAGVTPPAVLNGTFLHELAMSVLGDVPPVEARVRAACCAEPLTFGVTLSNTLALPYTSRVPQTAAGQEVPYVQYRHAEQESHDLDQNLDPADPLWARIGDLARASAAIPFVFPLVPLARRFADPHQYLVPPAVPNGEGGTFWYYDGGAYNGLPVDLAWHHIQRRGGDLSNRVLVVINPRPPAAGAVELAPGHPSLFTFAGQLLGGLITESGAQKFDHEVRDVPSAARQATAPAAGTRDLEGADHPPVELLEHFALITTAPGDPPLCGMYLQQLSAFLDQRFREYDFRRGAADARQMASKVLHLTYDSGRPAEFYAPDSPGNPVFDLSSYTALDAIPVAPGARQSVRQVFEAAVDGRVRHLIADYIRRTNPPGPDGVYAGLLDGIYALIRPRIYEQIAQGWHPNT